MSDDLQPDLHPDPLSEQPRPAARRKRTRPTEQEAFLEAKSVSKRRREVNSECTHLLACGRPYLTHHAAHAAPQLPPTMRPGPHCTLPDGPTAPTPPVVPPSLLEEASYTIKEQSVPPVMLRLESESAAAAPTFVSQASDSGAGASSLAYIEAASHEARIRRATAERSDKGTGIAYARHVQSYSEWWDGYQASRLEEDPSWSRIPTFPITAAKAALFLDHEVSRMKVRKQPLPLPRGPPADQLFCHSVTLTPGLPSRAPLLAAQ